MKHDDASHMLASSGGNTLERRLLDDDSVVPGGEDGSRFALALPFERVTTTPRVGDDDNTLDAAAAAAASARLASLLGSDDSEVSAEIAEQERIDRTTPTVYLPGNKQRQSRSILTIVVSTIAVLALAGVGVLFAVKSQAATPEQAAFDAYATRQLSVADENRAMIATFDAIATAKAEAEAVNLAAAASLAAVAGTTDEVARAAAETQRLATASAIAAIAVADPVDAPYVVPDVSSESSLSEIAAGLDELSAEATRIESAQSKLDAALLTITEARDAFTTAFTAFVDTVPAAALNITEANQEADQQWRDAVTTAVAALVAATEKGSGVSELQAYAAAVLALQAENARVVREGETVEEEDQVEDVPRRAPTRPRGDTVPGTGPPSEEADPTPVVPAPEVPPTDSPPPAEDTAPGEPGDGAPA